jgi:Domain of unknown function (DU1801)
MSTIKTTKNDASVEAFIHTIEDETKRHDSFTLLELYKQITKEDPRMWGTSIIGFGSYHYKSERSTQEGDWMLTGFSPRKQNLTLYFMLGFDAHTDALAALGKHKVSKSCLYIRRLSDVDMDVLRQLITIGYENTKQTYSPSH